MITNELISEIKSKINDNHKQAVTGGILQGVLVDMVKGLSEAYPQIYTEEQKAQARANIDALSNHNGEITKEKLSAEVQAILEDVPNKQNITDESLATISKTIVGAINELFNGGVKDKSIATSKIEDEAITEDKLASQSVTSAKIANASVSEEKITDNSVSTEKLKDGAITEPKLDTDLVNVITSAVQPAELASAIAAALASYVAKSDIVDTTGSATDKVMSQHGVTEEINGVTNKVTDLAEKVNGKQDALTLTVKDNGNIVISNIQGQSKEFMPATPSGDPMHYSYIAAGAEYNDTGADIVKDAPWADLADDDADKTIVHKAGYWYLNGLGDLTNNDMLNILQTNRVFSRALFAGPSHKFKTNISFIDGNPFSYYGIDCSEMIRQNYKIEVLRIPKSDEYAFGPKSIDGLCFGSTGLVHILGPLSGIYLQSISNTTFQCKKLRTIKFRDLKCNASFSMVSGLTLKSVLYMINNEAATSPITITLHAVVYNRCMANADILAALETHTNISLASA